MDQYLLIQFLVGWTSIYQLFWCSPRVQGFDTVPYTPPHGNIMIRLHRNWWQPPFQKVQKLRASEPPPFEGVVDGKINAWNHPYLDILLAGKTIDSCADFLQRKPVKHGDVFYKQTGSTLDEMLTLHFLLQRRYCLSRLVFCLRGIWGCSRFNL